jgi:DNA-nicking Smr family endonuclease
MELNRNMTKKLTDEDKKIWKRVTQDVTPLGEPVPFKLPNVVSFEDVIKSLPQPKIKKRSIRIEARIDLHGLTRNEAHHKLTTFLCVQKQKGAKCVLVITGKGYDKNKKGAPGILKRKVPLWLEISNLVKSFTTARIEDGGEGALYVYLK